MGSRKGRGETVTHSWLRTNLTELARVWSSSMMENVDAVESVTDPCSIAAPPPQVRRAAPQENTGKTARGSNTVRKLEIEKVRGNEPKRRTNQDAETHQW